MYEAFFNLQTSPFSATPLVANYFPAAAIESARQALIRVIERAEGPGLVIGPAGVGKSLLLRSLAEHFEEQFGVILLSGTRIATRKALLQSVLFELGMSYRGLDEGELRLGLIDALRPGGSYPLGVLLLIDEAHTLPPRLLDEVRMITNVVRDGQPRARLVLAGGQSLEERFANPKLESFSQRVAARCYLQSLNRDETNEYVRAQLSWAGGDPDAILDADAPRAIYQASDGIPRLINQVCDHAMVLAHAQGIERLSATLIQEAWADLQQLPPPWQPTSELPAAPGNTVIEFGELGDSVSGDNQFVDTPDESDELQELSPYVEATLPHSADSMTEQIMMDLEALTSVVVGYSLPETPVEWFAGDAQEGLTPTVHRAPNPFETPFEEEVVVIDRVTADGVEALRGRTRVSCHATRDILAQLRATVSEDAEDAHDVVDSLTTFQTLLGTEYSTAFEYSTWEPQSEEPAGLEIRSEEAGVVHAFADDEHDFDEEIECVSLPWLRGRVGDDRDVIVVEEDYPDAMQSASDVAGDTGTRCMEYRELFAQLRRTSP